ncbi:MAG: hypothetical protein HXX08_00975 [Chloroflexi bacterium]|uniref:Uncharacterized protein n=1 Tax=Candidatus Chlorohelix allophototropha TaxID=3003348 RepID=A0A8T7LR12_9CHLR|nr:hypothetical protein [Chloroflexota bacterium]WJW66320.1 hypothetical protein OZ401_002114 [Chloroflexota bacterium L227-S17]
MSNSAEYISQEVHTKTKRALQPNWRFWFCILTLLIAGQNIAHLVSNALAPMQLDYSEGLLLGGVEQILREPNPAALYNFKPDFYDATVLAYPPLFPYLSALLARLMTLVLGVSGWLVPLYAMRLLSFTGLSLTTYFIYKLARLYNPSRLVSLTVASLFLCAHPVIFWGSTGRVDALGISLILAGLYATLKSLKAQENPGLNLLLLKPLPLFWLAFFTKQSLVAAPLALALYLFLARRRRHALIFGGIYTLAVGLGVLALSLLTDGRYLFFITMERYTPFALDQMLGNWILFLLLQAPIITVVVWLSLPIVRHQNALRLPLLWGGLAATTALTVGKTGAADYYFFEAVAALCVLAGCLLLPATVFKSRRWVWRVATGLQILVLLASMIPVVYQPNNYDYLKEPFQQAVSYVKQYSDTNEKLFIELSGSAFAAGRGELVFDHFIFRQLARVGQRDGQLLIEDVKQHNFKMMLFGFDVLHEERNGAYRWPEGFEQTVRQHYRLIDTLRGSEGQDYAWILIPKEGE